MNGPFGIAARAFVRSLVFALVLLVLLSAAEPPLSGSTPCARRCPSGAWGDPSGRVAGDPARPSGGTSSASSTAGVGTGGLGSPPVAAGPGTVRFGRVLGALDPRQFWAIEGHIPNGPPDPRLAALVNATPFRIVRFAAGVDATNQTLGVLYSESGRPEPAVMNPRQYVVWCGWIHCLADWNLPAETGDVGAAAFAMRYVESTLHFRPTFWSIGNEPWGWTHYGIPWTDWRPTDDSRCDAGCYARLVQRMVPALRAVDPAARIIGIQNSDCSDSAYLRQVASLDGRLVDAVACHDYPLASNPRPTLAQFFAALSGPSGLSSVVPEARAAVAAGCGCALPVYVGEYNAFVISGLNPLMGQYPEVPWMAASVVQALALNLSQFEFYAVQDTGSAAAYDLVDPGDAPAPVYGLFRTVLSNLFPGAIVAVALGAAPAGVYAVETVVGEGNHHSLLVVNTNLSRTVPLRLAGSGFPLAGAGMSWLWTPATAGPSVVVYGAPGLPANWSVPPESVLLLNSA